MITRSDHTITITGLSPEAYDTLKQKAEAQGFIITGSAGMITTHNCTFTYVYGDVTQTLTITLRHAPPFMSGMAMGKLEDALRGALGAQ